MASKNASTGSKSSQAQKQATKTKTTNSSVTPESQIFDILEDLAISYRRQDEVYKEGKELERESEKLKERFSAMIKDRLLAIAQFKQGDYVVVDVNCQKRVGIITDVVPKSITYGDIRSYYESGVGIQTRSPKDIMAQVIGILGQIEAGLMSVESKSWLQYEVALIRPNGYAEVNRALYQSAAVSPYHGDFVTVVPKVAKLQV